MTRRAGTALHAVLVLIGAVLYFLFILPRWWVLTGDMPSTLATAGRIAAGLPIALAAIPVFISLQQGLKPSAQTPELALRLRAWSAVLHLIAGALILVAAIAEIWLGLGAAGPWLFGVYGAAAAIAILGIVAFHLSYRAEKPPAPPKQRKLRLPKLRRRGAADAATEIAETSEATEAAEATETAEATEAVEAVEIVETVAKKPRRFGRKRAAKALDEATDVVVTEVETTADVDNTEAPETPETAEPATAGGLRNKRPTGKSRQKLPR